MDKDRRECHLRPEFIRKLSKAGTEHIYYPAMCHIIPEGFEHYARTVLNETEENKEKGIRKLREFARKENLKCLDDSHLIMVLRSCKYDIKKSQFKLKRLLKLRLQVVTELAKLDMKTIESLIDGDFFQILPYRDRDRRIIIFSIPRLQLDKYEIEDVEYFTIAAILFCLSFPMSQAYGIAYIGDSSVESISAYYPVIKLFKKFIPRLMEMPCRITRLDLTNDFFLCRWLYTLLRPVLSDKISKRVIFHGSNFEDLHKHYHVDFMPGEVCGKRGPFSNKHYREDLLNFIEKLRAEN